MTLKEKLIISLYIIISLLGFAACEDLFDQVENYSGNGGDINTAANTYSIYVYDRGTVSSLNSISIGGLSFSSAADLTIRLISPTGTSVTILNQKGESNAFTGDYTFVSQNNTDGINHLVDYSGVIVPGEVYCADASFSQFNGEAINGTWDLRIYNHHDSFKGTFNNWSFKLNYTETTTDSMP